MTIAQRAFVEEAYTLWSREVRLKIFTEDFTAYLISFCAKNKSIGKGTAQRLAEEYLTLIIA